MHSPANAESRPAPPPLELQNFDRQIARLVAQLQRDNETIARLIEDRQRRRRELLAVQEQKLRVLRDEG